MSTHVLIIEDDTQIRENIAELLTLNGFRVETAANGRQGISQSLLHPPDLILCDILMPEVDGYQVLDVVRGHHAMANIPFIFLTAKTEPADLRRGMIQGADDYLTKPFTLQNLLQSINSRLGREARRKAELQKKIEAYRHSLAAVSTHETNTALTSIIGFSSLLSEIHPEIERDEITSMSKMIWAAGLRLKRLFGNVQLIDALQALTPTHPAYKYYTSGKAAIADATVISCIESIEQRLDLHIDYRVEVEGNQLSIGDENLRICLIELIDNAYKFSASASSVLIQGRAEAGGYRITLTNQGPPFSADDLARIRPFTQYNRQRYEQQGFGVGLSIVKNIMALNQGELQVHTPQPNTTSVSIWLPVATS